MAMYGGALTYPQVEGWSRESTVEVDYNRAVDFLVKRRTEVSSGKAPEELKKIKNYTFNDLATQYVKWCEGRRDSLPRAGVSSS